MEIAPHIVRRAQEGKFNSGLQQAGGRVNRSSNRGNFQAKHGNGGQLDDVICGWREWRARDTSDGGRLLCERNVFCFFFHAALSANLIIQE